MARQDMAWRDKVSILRGTLMQFRSKAEVATDKTRLHEYAVGVKEGSIVTYLEVETATGVPMNSRTSRDYLRVALKSAGHSFSSIPNTGYRISAADTALEFSTEIRGRMVSALNLAHGKQTALVTRHSDKMSQADKNKLSAEVALAGLLKSSAMNRCALKSVETDEDRPVPMLFGGRG